ncbi:MAG: diaminopimelate decarboxylase [Planctomycetes bacterium]|nr:diaminopimelate decarboxylase [Planctomycetota bacterium]
MDYFNYKNGVLYCEGVKVEEIARKASTPVYIYSARTFTRHFLQIKESFGSVPSTVCYSLKANSNHDIIKRLNKFGAGFDIVSGGELFRALKAGAPANRIVYAGVGKTDDEIEYAIKNKILCFNSESEEEVENIERIARKLKKTAQICLRVNPDVDPHTHVYITTGKKENKFGIDLIRAEQLAIRMKSYRFARLKGLHMHIGSQILEVAPYVEALGKVVGLLDKLRAMGHQMELLNIGGGFGIFYKEKTARPVEEFATALMPMLKKSNCHILLEPGRFIIGNAGILVTKVLYTKQSGDGRVFVICDAGMNTLIRPTLYGAFHRIWPARDAAKINGEAPAEPPEGRALLTADIVGPICESGDFFAKERKMPAVKRGDLLVVFSAGAYGYSMSSNYNSQPRPAETVVDNKKFRITARREKYNDITKLSS